MTNEEIWRPIDGWGNRYQVSSLGNVRASVMANNHVVYDKPHAIKPYWVHRYFFVKLCMAPIQKNIPVHRLVALAFHPNPENKPQVNHKNGIRTDNRAENLEWVTAKENTKHAMDIGIKIIPRGEHNGTSKLTDEKVREIRKRLKDGERPLHLAREFGITDGNIHFIKNSQTWKHVQ